MIRNYLRTLATIRAIAPDVVGPIIRANATVGALVRANAALEAENERLRA